MTELDSKEIHTQVVNLIYESLDELNEELDDIKIEKTENTVLLGEKSGLDSLNLVNLIVGTEQRVEDQFGFAISAIANEKAKGRGYHVAGEEWITWEGYHNGLAEAIGAKPPS